MRVSARVEGRVHIGRGREGKGKGVVVPEVCLAFGFLLLPFYKVLQCTPLQL